MDEEVEAPTDELEAVAEEDDPALGDAVASNGGRCVAPTGGD